jgi:hypothetical protein
MRARKGGAWPSKKRKAFSCYFSINNPKNLILSTKNSFSKAYPKIKVVHDFMLYNFSKRSKVKFQKDFEL